MQQALIDMERGTVWTMQPGIGPEYLGFVQQYFNVRDERPLMEQVNDGYMRTANCPFTTMEGFTLHRRGDAYELLYKVDETPEEERDPPLKEWGRIEMNGETAIMFDAAFLAIIDKDGKLHVGRVD